MRLVISADAFSPLRPAGDFTISLCRTGSGANGFVVRQEGRHAAFAGGKIHVVGAEAQGDVGRSLFRLHMIYLEFLFQAAPQAVAHELIIFGVNGEEAKQRGATMVLIINRYATEILATGRNVDGFVKLAPGRIDGLIVAYGPAAKEGRAFGFRGTTVQDWSSAHKKDKENSMQALDHQTLLKWPTGNFALRLVLAGFSVFVIFTGLRGISESWDTEGFPEALAVKLELLPLLFPLHMIAGGLALLLVPSALLLRGTRWHKVAGRVAAADVIIAGFTAFPVALAAPVTRGSAIGFAAQALTWLVLLGLGIWNIRRQRVAQHRAAMLMMAAVTSGALWFRVYLALWKLMGWNGGFPAFYAINAWLAWTLPLLVTAMVLRLHASRSGLMVQQ